MTETQISDSDHLKMKEKRESCEEIEPCNESNNQVPITEEIEFSLPTPLMFSRTSSLGSLSGFEQYSVHDDHSSIISEFSSRTSSVVSPLMNPSELFDYSSKVQMSTKSKTVQKVEEKMQMKSPNKVHVLNNPFNYDVMFRKPYFLKHSVFEDEIAAFKDESSPNVLSTTASSLSSLTIDDDDYDDNITPNKAGLVTHKTIVMDLPLGQTLSMQEHWRQDPLGSACGPLQTHRKSEKMTNQYNRFTMHYPEKEVFNDKLNKCTNTISCEPQGQQEQKRNINWTCNAHDESNKSCWNSINNCYRKNMLSTQSGEKSNSHNSLCKSKLNIEYSNNDKLENIHQDERNHTTQLDLCNKYNKNTRYEKLYKEQDLREQNRISQISYKTNSEIKYYIDESNDLNAYEEQLLDQCIRRGMAKVTKRNISEIKPFCWDLNQICLTTRAMLNSQGDKIMKDRKDDRSKYRTSQRGPTRHVINSRTK